MFSRSAAAFTLRRVPVATATATTMVSSSSSLLPSAAAASAGAFSHVSRVSFQESAFKVKVQRRFHGNDEEHGHVLTGDRDKPITTNWIFADGSRHAITCYEGQTLLEVAQEHQLPIEGACAGSCACSTCHVYLKEEDYDQFEEPSDEENDMLDLAFFPQATSRLGCQIKVTKAVDGLEVQLPKATRNMAVDGYVAKPH